MKIGNVSLSSNLLFAPMAGFSEVGFRHLCAKFGAGMTTTELVSAKGLCYNNKGTDMLLATTPDTTPACVQLFGSSAEFMAHASQDSRLDRFDIIDINMGCPVRKVYNNGDGSALMNSPALICQIVQSIKDVTTKPVTVKIRAGVEKGKPCAVECAQAAEDGGADAVIVHPRYREQFYSGEADHTITAAVKAKVSIPVIASGDIVDAASLDRVKEVSGADGFMIGRGALGRPWIFSELCGVQVQVNKKDIILEHIDILLKYMPPITVANTMKLQLCYYARGDRSAKAVRQAVGQAKSLQDVLAVVDTYF